MREEYILCTTVHSSIIDIVANSVIKVSIVADPACSFGRIPCSCYIGCPAHCDESVQSCVNECVSGCFCPAGLFQLGSELCVQQQQCLDISTCSAHPPIQVQIAITMSITAILCFSTVLSYWYIAGQNRALTK